MSKNFVFALTLLISAAASAMEDPLSSFTLGSSAEVVTVGTPTLPTTNVVKEVSKVVIASAKEKKTAVAAATSKAVEIVGQGSNGLAGRLATPFVWIARKTKNGVVVTKDGVVSSAIAVKNAPGRYIQWCKDDTLKAGAITAGALVVAGAALYVAYNWYQQQKTEKKRAQELLNPYSE